MEKMIGWRKLTAWALVMFLCGFVSVKTVISGVNADVPAGVVDLIKWVTAFFFLGNGLEHLANNITVSKKE